MIRAVLLLTLCLTRSAYAGLDCDVKAAVKALEKLAKHPKATLSGGDEYYGLCLFGIEDAPKLRTRFETACSTILPRNPKHYVCIDVAAHLGIKQLGGVDLFDAVGTVMRIDPFAMGDPDGYAIVRYREIGDPRALPLVLQVWKDTIPKAAKRERRPQSMVAWSAWRQEAAKILGLFGGAAEKDFLAEQRDATKDRHVKRACVAAIAAIEQRLSP